MALRISEGTVTGDVNEGLKVERNKELGSNGTYLVSR